MAEISGNADDLSDMCRLCLSTGVTLFDVFQFSTEMGSRVSDVIMKCAPVLITKCDEMPNLICKLCHSQLEKSHRFQTQILQSEKKLQDYLQRRKKIKVECSEELLIHDMKADTAAKSPVSTECADDAKSHDRKFIKDMDVKEKEPAMPYSEKIIKEELIIVKPEIKVEPTDDNSLISTEYADDTIETFSNGCDSEFSYEKTKIHAGDKSRNIDGRFSADATEDFVNQEEWNKNTSANHQTHEKGVTAALIKMEQPLTVKKRGRPSSGSSSPITTPNSTPKRHRYGTETRPASEIQYDTVDHFPEYDGKKEATRCKKPECKRKTHVYCLKCAIHLCFTSERNCFKIFHQKL